MHFTTYLYTKSICMCKSYEPHDPYRFSRISRTNTHDSTRFGWPTESLHFFLYFSPKPMNDVHAKKKIGFLIMEDSKVKVKAQWDQEKPLPSQVMNFVVTNPPMEFESVKFNDHGESIVTYKLDHFAISGCWFSQRFPYTWYDSLSIQVFLIGPCSPGKELGKTVKFSEMITNKGKSTIQIEMKSRFGNFFFTRRWDSGQPFSVHGFL